MMMDEMEAKAVLAAMDDRVLELLRQRGDEVIEQYRAAAGDPLAQPEAAHAFACMSSAVDAFVAEIEAGVEESRRESVG